MFKKNYYWTHTHKNFVTLVEEDKMDEDILDLVDWKNVESSAETSIRSSKVAIYLDGIMLRHAKNEIRRLHGKTSEEEKQLEASKKVKENVKAEVEVNRKKKQA